MKQSVERRLAAILAADVAGYSRLMGLDEAGTARALREHRAAADPLIAQHGGRIVKTTGDGILIEFGSVVGAVQCAIGLQRLAAERNTGLPNESRIEWRIGIHIGDVLVEGDDILGDGVNIAARLEGIAEPGGICISDDAFRQVRGKIEAQFADMGEQSLKNIARPLRVYRIGPSPAPDQVTTHPTALPLPDKPSIAVLPFANMSADPEQEFFADGIAEDIITALSRYPSLFVIARNSSFTYKGRAVDVKQVGRELGVRYALEGSVRRAGDRVRLTAQLVEAEAGNHIWAERYDRDLADIFALQDEITEAVTIAIAPAIADAERHRAMRKPPESLDAWAAYQRGLWHFSKGTPDDNALAERFFQQAIDLDPSFAGGYTGLAFAQTRSAGVYGKRTLVEIDNSTFELARRAVALDGDDAEARTCFAEQLMRRGDYEAALAELEVALASSPNLASANGVLGAVLMWSGHPTNGRDALKKSIRLDPRNPNMTLRLLDVTISYYLSREYDAAVEAAKRSIRSYPDYSNTYRWLAAALGQTGRVEEATQALEKAIAMAPASFDMFVRRRVPWHRPEDHAHMLEGLRKAGWEG
jgi:adenylate cyclase